MNLLPKLHKILYFHIVFSLVLLAGATRSIEVLLQYNFSDLPVLLVDTSSNTAYNTQMGLTSLFAHPPQTDPVGKKQDTYVKKSVFCVESVQITQRNPATLPSPCCISESSILLQQLRPFAISCWQVAYNQFVWTCGQGKPVHCFTYCSGERCTA